jgi:hypothetical protein
MRARTRAQTAIWVAILLVAAPGLAAVVDIDALANCQLDDQGSNAVPIVLGPGTWAVVPIGTSDGGAFDAWNAWGRVEDCDNQGANCLTGWVHRYRLFSQDLPDAGYGDTGTRWQTPAQALANNAVATEITLPTEQTVSFFISDSNCPDNLGGASLSIERVVPALPTWGLALLALALVTLGEVALARRRTAG